MNVKKYFIILSSILGGFFVLYGCFILLFNPFKNDTSGNPFKDIFNSLKPSESINVLVMGVDKTSGNTDTILVVNFNEGTSKTSILSIPRDTKVTFNGGTHKVNSAFASGGSKLAIDTVSGLLNIKIKHYMLVKLSVFRDVVDQLGGVDYNVPVKMDYDDPTQDLYIHLNKGQQHMDGVKAEQYMRFRQPNVYTDELMKYYDGSDLKRIDAQQAFIKEFIRQKMNIKYLPKIGGVIKSVFSNIETDMDSATALKMVQNVIKIKADEVNMFKLPGQAENGGQWYYVADKNKTAEIVAQHFTSKSGSSKNSSKTSTSSAAQDKVQNQGVGSPAAVQPEAQASNQDTPQESSKTDFVLNNPSNGETGFTDIVNEAP